MTNAQLKKALEASFGPYAKGFLKHPAQARFDVVVSSDAADALLEMSASDFAVIDGSSALRAVLSRSYNGLCRHLDDTRMPVLEYAELP